VPYHILFLQALFLTVAIELAAGILLRIAGRQFGFFKKTSSGSTLLTSWPRLIIGIALASVMTLPYVWFIFPHFITYKPPYILVVEIFAWLTEAVLYKYWLNLTFSRAIIFSLVLNLCSFLFGVVT